MMELFTLGAGRGYSEHDVREQARALTGLRDDWRRGAGHVNFHFDRERHDDGAKTIFGKRGRFDWRDACRLCLTHPNHPSFFVDEALVLLRPDAAGRGDARARSSGSTADGLRGPAGRRGDPPPSGAATRARGWSSRRRLRRRPAARDRPRHRHRLVDVARARTRAAALQPAERGRLGRRALARHGHLPRPLVRRRRRGEADGLEPASSGTSARRPEALGRRRARASGAARRSTGDPRGAARVRAQRVGAAATRTGRKSYPLLSQNALRQLIAVSPDLQTCMTMARCLRRLLPHELLRRAAAGPGAGCPRSSRDARCPAGTGLDAAQLPRARRGARARRLRRARASLLGAFEEGIAAARRPGPQSRVLVSVFLDGRRRLALAALPGRRPALPQAAPEARAARVRRARRSPRTAACTGTRRSAPLAKLHGEGKVSVMPAIGYEHPDQSHFTSRHFWEVGALDAAARDRLARPLPRPRRHARQPAPGPLARRRLAGARDGEDAGRRDRRARATTTSGRRTCGATSRSGCSRRSATLGAPAGARRRGLQQATAVARQSAALRQQLMPFTGQGRPARLREPGRLPDGRRRVPEAARRRSRRCSAPACRSAASRSRRPATTTPTTTRPRTLADGLKLTADACSPSSATSRRAALADRVLVHVWSEFGRRAKENGSNGTDHGAAGAGFLIGSRVNGTMVGEFPGLAKLDEQRQPARDVRLPRPLLRAARAVAGR